MMPVLHGALRIADGAGAISRNFHRWLQLVERALRGPFVGTQAPGSTTILDGEYGIHAKRLTLAGKERLTIYGSGRLVICG